MTASAIDQYLTLISNVSGRAKTAGVPLSLYFETSEYKGSVNEFWIPNWVFKLYVWPSPKILCSIEQVPHLKYDMFSTIAKVGTFRSSNISIPFTTST